MTSYFEKLTDTCYKPISIYRIHNQGLSGVFNRRIKIELYGEFIDFDLDIQMELALKKEYE